MCIGFRVSGSAGAVLEDESAHDSARARVRAPNVCHRGRRPPHKFGGGVHRWAMAVLQQRIAGTAGRLEDLHRVRMRLMHMHKGLKSGLHHSEKRFSPESVAQRLAAPFFMPDATAYPELRTVAQQAKVDAVASAKAEAESAARAKADAARPGERYCCASLR